jgi:hypothetical protein
VFAVARASAAKAVTGWEMRFCAGVGGKDAGAEDLNGSIQHAPTEAMSPSQPSERATPAQDFFIRRIDAVHKKVLTGSVPRSMLQRNNVALHKEEMHHDDGERRF